MRFRFLILVIAAIPAFVLHASNAASIGHQSGNTLAAAARHPKRSGCRRPEDLRRQNNAAGARTRTWTRHDLQSEGRRGVRRPGSRAWRADRTDDSLSATAVYQLVVLITATRDRSAVRMVRARARGPASRTRAVGHRRREIRQGRQGTRREGRHADSVPAHADARAQSEQRAVGEDDCRASGGSARSKSWQLMGDYFMVGTMMNAVDQHLPPTRQALMPALDEGR